MNIKLLFDVATSAIGAIKEMQLRSELECIQSDYEKADRIDILNDVRKICDKYREKGLQVDKLSRDDLANAYRYFPIPESEDIIAFCDTTIFDSRKTGMAIGVKGIYLKNDFVNKSDIKKQYLSWAEFKKENRIQPDGEYSIWIGENNLLSVAAADIKRDDMVEFLNELKYLFVK